MGKLVDEYILKNWIEYLLAYAQNDFEIPKSRLHRNPLLGLEDYLFQVKEAAGNDLKKELGMPYERNKTSDMLDPLPTLYNPQSLDIYLYQEVYLDNKELLLYTVAGSLGHDTEAYDSAIKKVFLKGLEDLLTKTNPDFLYQLQNYLANSEYVLNDLKKYLGVPDEDNTFDSELTILLKSGYQRLFEMVSSDEMKTGGFQNYLYQTIFEGGLPYFGNIIEVGKEWLYLYVKLSFDPPTASTLTYLKERLNELEWYIVNYNLGDWIYGEQKHAGDKTSWD